MDMSVDKLKAVVGLAVDKIATTMIQDIAGQNTSLKNYSYDYNVLIEREDGSIKISLSDSEENEVLSIDFNANYDFEDVISHYS